MKFLDWIKIKEQSEVGVSTSTSTSASTSTTTTTTPDDTGNFSYTSHGLISADIKSVPSKLQLKSTCSDCSKDWKNWYIKKKKRKKS